MLSVGPLDRRTILANLRQSVNYQWRLHLEAEDTHWRRAIRMDPLRVCQTMLMLLQRLKDRHLSINEHAAVLKQLWDSLGGGLETVQSRHIEGHPEVAKQCLEMINSLDISTPSNAEDEQAFATWAREFPHAMSLFPDPFITSLSRFLPPGDDITFSHRLRRIRLLGSIPADAVSDFDNKQQGDEKTVGYQTVSSTSPGLPPGTGSPSGSVP